MADRKPRDRTIPALELAIREMAVRARVYVTAIRAFEQAREARSQSDQPKLSDGSGAK